MSTKFHCEAVNYRIELACTGFGQGHFPEFPPFFYFYHGHMNGSSISQACQAFPCAEAQRLVSLDS